MKHPAKPSKVYLLLAVVIVVIPTISSLAYLLPGHFEMSVGNPTRDTYAVSAVVEKDKHPIFFLSPKTKFLTEEELLEPGDLISYGESSSFFAASSETPICFFLRGSDNIERSVDLAAAGEDLVPTRIPQNPSRPSRRSRLGNKWRIYIYNIPDILNVADKYPCSV